MNEFDIEGMFDIAKICDEAARILEKAIIPPCKVGDVVYVNYRNTVVNAYIISFEITSKGIVAKVYIDPDTYEEYDVEDLFLSQEEAEKALKGGVQG